MRILFAAPRFPWPLSSGEHQRTYYLLKALARKHEIGLTTAVPDSVEAQPPAVQGLIREFVPGALAEYGERSLPEGRRLQRIKGFLRDLRSERAPYYSRLPSQAWIQAVAAVAGQYDAFFCRYASILPLLQHVPAEKVVIDLDDVPHIAMWRKVRSASRWERPLFAVEACRAYLYVRSWARRAGQTLVCSGTDRKRLRTARATVVPNGVDIPQHPGPTTSVEPGTVLFVGTLSYAPNSEGLGWFIKSTWPSVRAQCPTARLLIVGSGCAEALLGYDGHAGIEIVGRVASLDAFYARSVVSVVPLLYGVGTRIKIAESLAYGRPVVSTSIGAEGYDGVGESAGLLRADSPDGLAKAVAEILNNPGRAAALGSAGRTTAQRRFSWDSITATLADDVESWTSPGIPS